MMNRMTATHTATTSAVATADWRLTVVIAALFIAVLAVSYVTLRSSK
jgi:hypothetical protein